MKRATINFTFKGRITEEFEDDEVLLTEEQIKERIWNRLITNGLPLAEIVEEFKVKLKIKESAEGGK